MGTRNLTCVIQNGDFKVAQYGQWDGYPGGQGLTISGFVSKPELVTKLKANLAKVRFLDAAGRDKEFIKSYQANAPQWSNEPDNRTEEQRKWFATYVSRDIAADILTAIANSEDAEIVLRDQRNFAADSLFCEWAYVVDLDNEVIEVYRGFNQSKAVGRFADMPTEEDSAYTPVTLIGTLPFADATEEAMLAFDQQEGDD